MQDAAMDNIGSWDNRDMEAGHGKLESIQSENMHPIWPLRLMAHLPPEQEGNSGTMIVRHQLPGHVNTIDAICFNKIRQQLLTADRSCLRLWSLRKELKRINLIPNHSGGSEVDDNLPAREALVVSLIHVERRDLYICVFGGDPRTKGTSNFVDPAVVKVFHPSLSLLLQFNAHTAPVVAATFHQQREELITSSTSVSLKVWNFDDVHDEALATKQQILPPASPLLYVTAPNASAIQIVIRRVLQDHDRPITLLHTAKNCEVVFGSGGTDVWAWSLSNGNLLRVVRGLHNFATDMITSLQYIPELSELTVAYDDGVLATWLFHLPLDQTNSPQNVSSIGSDNAPSPDTDVSGRYNEKPRLCRDFPSHRGRVNCAILSDDRFSLFSCGADGDVRHFDAIHGVELGRLPLASTFRVAFKQGIRRVYPPFAIVHSRIKGPAGTREVLFTVAGSSITIAEIQSQKWRFGANQGSVLSVNSIKINDEDKYHSHVIVLRENNQINLIDSQTARVVTVVSPTDRLNPKGEKRRNVRRMEGHKKTPTLNYTSKQDKGINNIGRLNKGIAGLKSHGSLENNIHSTRRNSDFGNNLKSIGNSSNLLQVVKMVWWEELKHCVLGWSDGAVEIFEPKRNGIRIRLVRDHVRCSPVTAVCILRVPCHGGRNSAFRGGSRVASTTLQSVLDAGSEVGGHDSRSDRNLQLGGSCPSTELNGPWGGPVRYRKTIGQINENVRLEHEKNMAKFTIISGSADGYILLWDVVKSKLITSLQAHSGPIVDILEIPTLDHCNGVVHPIIGKMLPPPTKNTLVSIGEDGIIKIWSAWRSGRLNQVAFFLAQPSNITSSTQTWKDNSSGKNKTRRSKITSSLVIKGSRCLIIGYDNGCMQAWELQTDLSSTKDSKSLRGDDKVLVPFWSNQSHIKGVTSMAAPSIGDYFASASLDGTIMMWTTTLLENLNLPNIVLLRSFNLSLPIRTIRFIAKNRVILASHFEGMTVLKANIRSGVAQRKILIEKKEKKRVHLESKTIRVDNEQSKSGEKLEDVIDIGQSVDLEHKNSQLEEKDDAVTTHMEDEVPKKSFPITGYIPYSEANINHIKQHQNNGNEANTRQEMAKTLPAPKISETTDFELANQLQEASVGGVQRTKSMSEIPKMSGWGDRNSSNSIPSGEQTPPGARLHNAEKKSALFRQNPRQGWGSISNNDKKQPLQKRASGTLNSTLLESDTGIDVPVASDFGELEAEAFEIERENITRNFSIQQEIERSLSTRGSNIRPFSTGENASMNENSVIDKLQFSHNRPGSREGIIKIVVSGTTESTEDTDLNNNSLGESNLEDKSSIINTKSQLPLEGTSMECLSEDALVDMVESKSDVENVANEPLENHTSSGQYFVDAKKGLDPTAISLLRQKFSKLCIQPQIKVKFTELPKVLEEIHINVLGNDSRVEPKLWKLWSLYESLFKHKRSVPEAAIARMREPSSNYQRQLMDQRAGRTLVSFDDFLLLATAFVHYVKLNVNHLAKLRKKQQVNSQSSSNLNVKTVVQYNSVGEAKTFKRNISVSKGVSENRMWKEIDLRAKRAEIVSKARFESMMQKPDVWDDNSNSSLCITPKNKWRQHSQLAINTLSAFARQLSNMRTWPKLHPIYKKIHKKKLQHVMLTREQQASQELKELGVNYTRPIPLRKVLKMITQIWRDKEAQDVVQDRHSQPRLQMPEFLHEWHMKAYGLIEIAGPKLILFLESILVYREVPACRMMARFAQVLIDQHQNSIFSLLPFDSTSLGIFSDAQQWIYSRSEFSLSKETVPLVNMLTEDSPEAVRLKVPLGNSYESEVLLISTYRAVECLRAMFDGPPDLLESISSHISSLPVVITQNIDEFVECDCVLEAIVSLHGVWQEELRQQKNLMLQTVDDPRPFSPKSSIVIAMPSASTLGNLEDASLQGKSSPDNADRLKPVMSGASNGKPTSGIVIGALKTLLDNFILCDKKSKISEDESFIRSNSTGNGTIVDTEFAEVLRKSTLWSGSVLSDTMLHQLALSFKRRDSEEISNGNHLEAGSSALDSQEHSDNKNQNIRNSNFKVSYLEFWSRLYQIATVKESKYFGGHVVFSSKILNEMIEVTVPSQITELEGNRDTLKQSSVVESYMPRSGSVNSINNTKSIYAKGDDKTSRNLSHLIDDAKFSVTRGHGRGTRTAFLALAEKIANDNPETESMTLNLEQTTPSFLVSTHLKETSSTLKEPSQHDSLVEKTSNSLEIVASQAPYRTCRPDNTNYIHQLDHGTHDRTDKNTRYAPVTKHPASMSKAEMREAQEEMLRSFGRSLLNGEQVSLPQSRPISSASSSILQEQSNVLESSSLVHDSTQHVVVTRRATTPAASLTRVATPSLKSSIMKAIKGSSIFEQDQIEAALRCIMRVSGTSQYFEILMSLLSNASPAEILTSITSETANSDDLQEEELSRAKAIVRASFQFPAQIRRAATAVLQTAITKAEVVAVCTMLISQSSSTDIIRASDVVLPTAVTRNLGQLAKENIFNAISTGNHNWLSEKEIQKLGELIAEASQTSEGLEILRITLEGNLLHVKNEEVLKSSSATNEVLDTHEQDIILKCLKRAHRRDLLDKKQLQTCIRVITNAMTKAEALAIMVSVIRGDDENDIATSAEKAETEVMSVTHAVRAASRHDKRREPGGDILNGERAISPGGLTIIDPPTLEEGIRPNAFAYKAQPSWKGAGLHHAPVKDVSDRLYPPSFRDQPPHWDAAKAKADRSPPHSPKISPRVASKERANIKSRENSSRGSAKAYVSGNMSPDKVIQDDVFQVGPQIPNKLENDYLRVLPDDRLSTILNETVGINSDEEQLLTLQKQRENRGNMVEHEGSEYRKKKALMRRAKEKSKTGIKVTGKESIKSMMKGSKIHSKPKLDADDDSFSEGSEFELSHGLSKEDDQGSDMEKEYLNDLEHTSLEKDSNHAGNRAWTTRGSNVPMELQLNDTLHAKNGIVYSNKEETEDKKDNTALVQSSQNIVPDQGLNESISAEDSNGNIRSLVDDIFEEDKWKVDELLQAVDSHIVGEEEIPTNDVGMMDNSSEAEVVLYQDSAENPSKEKLSSSNFFDAPSVKNSDERSECVKIEASTTKDETTVIGEKDEDNKNMSTDNVDETNALSIKELTDDAKEPIIPLEMADDIENRPSTLSITTATSKASEDLPPVQEVQPEVSKGTVDSVASETKKESHENLDSKNLSDNQTSGLELVEPREIKNEVLFSTEDNDTAEAKEEKILEDKLINEDSVEESIHEPPEPFARKVTDREAEIEGAKKPKDEICKDDQIELVSEAINKDQSDDAVGLENSNEVKNDNMAVNAQDDVSNTNSFDVVTEQNATSEQVIDNELKHDDVEDGNEASKNLDMDGSETGDTIDQVKVEEMVVPGVNGDKETAEIPTDDIETTAIDENEIVADNQNGDKVMEAEDYDRVDGDNYKSTEEEEEIDDHVTDADDGDADDGDADDGDADDDADDDDADDDDADDDDADDDGEEDHLDQTDEKLELPKEVANFHEEDDKKDFKNEKDIMQTKEREEIIHEETRDGDDIESIQEIEAESLDLMENFSDQDSDAMDSEDDELSLDALLKIQQDALTAKRLADELAKERREAKDKSKSESAADRNAAIKAMETAMKEAQLMDEKLQNLMYQRAERDSRRNARMKNRKKPRKRSMAMDGLNPEYKLSFSDNLKFKPFQLMKGPSSVPQWDIDDAFDESDGPDSDNDGTAADLKAWRKEKEQAKNTEVTDSGAALSSSFLYETNPVQLPDGWEYGPPMVQTLHPLWKKWFKLKEKKIMSWTPLEIEEEEIDKEAKKLEEQKAANADDDEEFFMTREKKRKLKKQRTTKLWNKLRAHTKTKWRMSRALRKTRMKNMTDMLALKHNASHTDTIPFGETKGDEMSAYKYFAIDIMDMHSILTITLAAEKGDPDIYVSTTVLPTKTDHTWRAASIGKCRLVVYPNDENFVVGRYVVGIYSRVPAKFTLAVDVTGGEYTSKSLDTVIMMTRKFNTIAEGFDRAEEKRIVHAPPPKPKRLTAEERAAEFLRKQHEAEVKIAKMKREASIFIQKQTRNTKKAVHSLNKKLHESLTQAAFINAFYKEIKNDALDGFVLSDSEESEHEEVVEEVAEHVEVQSPTQSDIVKANQHQMNDDASDVSDGEISSENEDEQASALCQSVQKIDPMKLWRPKFGLTSHEKMKYDMNHEEPQLTLPKPTFFDKRVAIEKKMRLKAELAMPRRTAYKTRKMGKTFMPKRTLKGESLSTRRRKK